MNALLAGAMAPAAEPAPLATWAVLLVTAFCLLATGFYSGTETGLMSTSRVRLRRLAGRRAGGQARLLLGLLDRLEESILTCLIGNNLVNVLGSAVVTVALTSRYGAHGELMAMVLMSLLIIVLGEILPKSFFREYPERLTWAAAPFLRATQLLLLPVLLLLRLYTRLWSRLLPAHEAESGALDRQTLATLFLAHTPPGGQDARFRAILDRYLHLSELDLRALMHPLATVRAVRMQATVAACMQESETSGFSRLPVLDAGGRLQGWLLARDLLFLPDGVGRDDPLPPSLVRTPLLVDAGMSPFELFEELHAQGYEMAFVTDEGGEVLGMATREDLVEAIVGSIRDEFDRSRDESRAAPMGRDPGWLSS